MFKFKPTKKTYSDPVAAVFKPGIPFGRKFSKGDICLLHDGFHASKLFLNSTVLREALLNSKEFIEEICEISIVDRRDTNTVEEVKDMEVIEGDLAKGDVPESGKSLILESEDLIVGNADIETSDITFPELPENEEKVADEVIIEGVDEIPEDATVVDEVIIDAPAEVAEEIVDAVEEKKTKKTNKK